MELRHWIFVYYDLRNGMQGMAGVLDGTIPEDCLVPPVQFTIPEIRGKWVRCPDHGMVVAPNGAEYVFGVVKRSLYERGILK